MTEGRPAFAVPPGPFAFVPRLPVPEPTSREAMDAAAAAALLGWIAARRNLL